MLRLLEGYNYESPISLAIQQLQEDYNAQLEDGCMMVIREKIGIDVKKEELIKALNYDRGQYEKGLRDGLSYAMKSCYEYCPHCGERISERTDENE